MTFIADEIAPRLFMGPYPPAGPYVARAGFSTLILAAKRSEYRVLYGLRKEDPVELAFPGVPVIFVADLDDDYSSPLTDQEFMRAQAAANAVVRTIRNQENALVTCVMGRNRSGLIVALALRQLGQWTGHQAVARVRLKRITRATNVLENPQFAGILEKLPQPSPASAPCTSQKPRTNWRIARRRLST
jgi:hypothetical protein